MSRKRLRTTHLEVRLVQFCFLLLLQKKKEEEAEAKLRKKGEKIGCNKIIHKNGFLTIEGETQVLQIGSNSRRLK